MNLHKHARLTPRGRALLVARVIEHGLRVEEAAHAAGVSVRTAYKWLRRFREEGRSGLHDRSSRPDHSPHATPAPVVQKVMALRRERQSYRQISMTLQVAPSTIARLLRRAGLHRLAELEPARPDNRYEHAAPGDLLHLDIKKLGRFWRPGHRVTGDRSGASEGAGWEFVHLAIDDHSRVAFGTIEPDERGTSACRALLSAVRYYRALDVRFQRVLTDNGACYKSRRFRRLVTRLSLRHLRTRPYESSVQRAEAFPRWLHHYNWHRPHASVGYQAPASRLTLPLNNVVGLHS